MESVAHCHLSMPQILLTSVELIKAYAKNMKILTAPCNLFALHENGRESQNKWDWDGTKASIGVINQTSSTTGGAYMKSPRNKSEVHFYNLYQHACGKFFLIQKLVYLHILKIHAFKDPSLVCVHQLR